ncbi:8699_t:CDS:2, partial [Gigaspora rosea]
EKSAKAGYLVAYNSLVITGAISESVITPYSNAKPTAQQTCVPKWKSVSGGNDRIF